MKATASYYVSKTWELEGDELDAALAFNRDEHTAHVNQHFADWSEIARRKRIDRMCVEDYIYNQPSGDELEPSDIDTDDYEFWLESDYWGEEPDESDDSTDLDDDSLDITEALDE